MTISDIVGVVTGERMITKYTGVREGPPRDEIAALAYRFYERRGWQPGHDVDDWLSAERALQRRYQ